VLRKTILLPIQTTQICRLRRFDCPMARRTTGLISCKASDEQDPQQVTDHYPPQAEIYARR
jgi:hypothetical protein